MKKIIYTIEKSKDNHIVWKNVESKNAIGCKSVFKGNEQACQQYLKDRKIKVNEVIIIND